mgnify:CR=1 FL=1
MAYQTLIVIVLALGSLAFGLSAGHESALGITQPCLTLAVIPTVLPAFTIYAYPPTTLLTPHPHTTDQTKTTPSTPPALFPHSLL